MSHLLDKVLEDYRDEIAKSGNPHIEKAADLEVDTSTTGQPHEPGPASPNRPESLPSAPTSEGPTPTASTTTVLSPKAPKATPEDLEETSPPPTMIVPRHP